MGSRAVEAFPAQCQIHNSTLRMFLRPLHTQCSAVLPTPFKLRRVCRRGQQCLWEQGSPRSCDSSGSMAPGKTKHKHGHHSKKKRHKWKIGLELKKRTKDHDQIHVRVGNFRTTPSPSGHCCPPATPAGASAVRSRPGKPRSPHRLRSSRVRGQPALGVEGARHPSWFPHAHRAGQHYCTYCDRYFTNNDTLSQHTRSKAHRRR